MKNRADHPDPDRTHEAHRGHRTRPTDRSPRTHAHRRTGLVACAAAVGVVVTVAVPATAGRTPAALPTADVPPGSVEIVDPDATAQTASLFQYLQDVQGEGILFGHQHTTSYGVTVGAPDMVQSDVLGAVGDHPAVFGWDTLILQGDERPGQAGNTAPQNIAVMAQYIESAHALGGINTLSAHMENFVTGGSFYDTTGDTLRAVLPGGTHHDELRAYLDTIALLAESVDDAEGDPIPIIFRPWHENAGSWFWWGAAFGSPGEYAELYRFTVEYLRDVKGVHNVLYAFSPGGGFNGDAELYLRTYPGDEYIDILGYDSYDDGNAGDAWLNQIVADLGMISDEAIARNKVSAFTEFGTSTGALGDNGENPNLSWFTDVLAAIKADPKASRSAYMLTWANFGTDQYFVPYAAYDGQPAHELLPDFQAYEADPFTSFADEVTGAFDRTVPTVAHDPLVHLVSPADGARVATSPATVRAKVAGIDATEVTFTAGDATVDLTLDPDGLWWSGTWTIPAAALDNSTQAVSVTATDGVVTLTDEAAVVLGPAPVFGPGVVDDFEGYGDDPALRAAYTQVQSNEITLETTSVGQGDKAMRITYDVGTQGYTGVGKAFEADWSDFGELSLWVDPDASSNRLVLQLRAGGVSYEAYPPLTGDAPYRVSIPWADWRPAPWDTANAGRRITGADLADVAQFFVYVNSADDAVADAGSIVVDDIRATGEPPSFFDVAPGDPFYADIMWMLANGLTTGYADGTFRATAAVHRDAMAAFLHRYANGSTPVPACTTAPFTDVPVTHPFCGEIAWLADQGVTTGHPDGTYRPGTPVSREAMAAFLYRTMFGSGAEAPACTTAPFTDVTAGHPFCGEITWLAGTEPPVTTGWPDGTFRPGAAIERQAMAAFLHRFDQVPPPVPPFELLYDFTGGTQGWTPASWDPRGSVAAVDGNLQVTADDAGNWFGLDAPGPSLEGRTTLSFELDSATVGTSFNYAVKLGPDWTWCQGQTWEWVDASAAPTTVHLDLTAMQDDSGNTGTCAPLMGEFRGLLLFFDGGVFEIDDVRVS